MNTLILHIGLPRTGTTTLQQHVFLNHRQFLGKDGNYDPARTMTGSNEESREIVLLSRGAKLLPGSFVWEKTVEWTEKVKSLGRAQSSDIMISDEGLCAWDVDPHQSSPWPICHTKDGLFAEHMREYPHPLIHYLNSFLIPAWMPDAIKVVFTTREPSDWVPSLYSQCTEVFGSPSQAHFDAIVDSLTRQHAPSLDWKTLYLELQSALGLDNVLTLRLEDMSTELYWDKLCEFTGINRPSSYLPNTNSRSYGGKQHVFSIRSPAPKITRKLRRRYGFRVHPVLNHSWSIAGRIETICRSVTRNKGKSFTITDDQVKRIKECSRLPFV